MRILVDENVPVQILGILRQVLLRQDVQHIGEIGWSGKKDLTVLADASAKGFEAFLTRDGRQLENPSEAAAIKKSGIHHIRFSQSQKGMPGLGLAMGAVIAAMPLVVPELETASGQRLVHIKGLTPEPRHRFDLVDPAKAPPAYWPR
ncbi:DUF5615 family PIN-like protein [Actinacidiphila yeochonensis]|uniref:DUF5615 family PIN-like protein n=1 Tax=Actinacidiphila yeochonensis TaxID=89050 RepID=UPI00055B91EE|nr:DUF5615 family PIN-like protein [Actinacidiphila yeochonensis]